VNREIKKFFHCVQQQRVERLCGKGRKWGRFSTLGLVYGLSAGAPHYQG
jgi:hypothetical protein